MKNPSRAGAVLNDVAYEVYCGWMAYYKARGNERDIKSLMHRLQRARMLLEEEDMWPPRVEP